MNILAQKLSQQSLPQYIYNPGQYGLSPNNSNVKVQNNKAKTSIFYINDIHGQVPKMQRLVSASHHADRRWLICLSKAMIWVTGAPASVMALSCASSSRT